MSGRSDVTISKFLALVLRHDPARIGLDLTADGWANIDELLRRADEHGVTISEEDLRRVVRTNSKQRYVIDDATRRIRANQGHSIAVDLGLSALIPPDELFHGTAERNLESIGTTGIRPMQRRQVHLSPDSDTARAVGRRHGTPAVLVIDARRMHRDGREFFRSDNGVWLTEIVPPAYILRTEA